MVNGEQKPKKKLRRYVIILHVFNNNKINVYNLYIFFFFYRNISVIDTWIFFIPVCFMWKQKQQKNTTISPCSLIISGEHPVHNTRRKRTFIGNKITFRRGLSDVSTSI